MPRVVIGNFGAVVGMGMRAVLAQCGCDVVDEEASGEHLVGAVSVQRPDAVVLDVDHGHGRRLADELALRFPTVTVVALSSTAPRMWVRPAHHEGPLLERELDIAELADALAGR